MFNTAGLAAILAAAFLTFAAPMARPASDAEITTRKRHHDRM